LPSASHQTANSKGHIRGYDDNTDAEGALVSPVFRRRTLKFFSLVHKDDVHYLDQNKTNTGEQLNKNCCRSGLREQWQLADLRRKTLQLHPKWIEYQRVEVTVHQAKCKSVSSKMRAGKWWVINLALSPSVDLVFWALKET
jgi:hypothetical protein